MHFRRILYLSVLGLAFSSAVSGRPDCTVTNEHKGWLSGSLKAWQAVRKDSLRLPAAPLPWMVLFDENCVINIRSGEAPIASAHTGQVPIPGGGAVPARLLSFAASYDSPGGKRPFFVFSLPSMWRAAPHLKDRSNIDQLIRSVFVHEMTHTEHGHFHSRLDELEKRLPQGEEIDDDIIQNKFAKNDDFRAMVEAERDLLYRAANAGENKERRALARRALIDMVQRRTRFLVGENAVYAELENVFFTMEGAANWAAYRSIVNGGMLAAEAQDLIRGGRKYWSQEMGLAMFLVIDALLPGWQRRAFGKENATALELLADAVK